MSSPANTTQSTAASPNDWLVTVAICTRNRAGFLEKAIKSVLDQMIPGVELLVVDNASTDATPQFAQKVAAQNPLVRYYRENELGLSAARNASLENARGQYVLFLDDDAIAEPGWLKVYCDFFTHPPEERIACAGGPVYPDFEITPPNWLPPKWNVLSYGDTVREFKTEGGPWGGNAAYNKAATLALGAFNKNLGRKGNFAGSFEESDMNQRLKDAGWKLWWLPAASIKHFLPARRLNFKVLLRDRFDGGRSSAIMRLKAISGGVPGLAYRCVRLFTELLQLILNAIAASIVFVFGQRRPAAKLAFKAARSAGFGYQMLRF